MNSTQTHTERIIRGSFTVLLFTLLTSPLGYFLRVFYSRTLSVEMFGLLYAAISFFGIFTIFNDLGFGYSVTYLVPKYLKKGNYQRVWNLYKYDQIIEFLTSLLISIIIALLAPFLAESYFHISEARSIIYIFCVYLVSDSLLSALNKYFNGLQQEIYFSSIQFSRLFFAMGFSLLVWIFDIPSVINFAWAWSLSYLTATILYTILLKKKGVVSKGRLSWDKKLFSLMYSYALPTLLASSLYNFINYVDSIVLTYFRDVGEVGVYNVVLPLASVAGIFLYPINRFILPYVSFLSISDKRSLKILIESILKIVPTIGIYFGLFVSIFAVPLTTSLFGEKWALIVERPLVIFALTYSFALLMSYLINIVDGLGLVRDKLKFSSITAIFNVVVSIFMVIKFGVIGIIISNSLTYILSIYLFGKIISKSITFKYPKRYYLKMLLFCLSVYLTLKTTGVVLNTIQEIIIVGILYSIIFISFAYILGVADKQTLKIVREMVVKSKVNKS